MPGISDDKTGGVWRAAKGPVAHERSIGSDGNVGNGWVKSGKESAACERLGDHRIKIGIFRSQHKVAGKTDLNLGFCALTAIRIGIDISPKGHFGYHRRRDAKLRQGTLRHEIDEVVEALVEECNAQERSFIPKSLFHTDVKTSAALGSDWRNAVTTIQVRSVWELRDQTVDRRALVQKARFLNPSAKVKPQLRQPEGGN